MNVCVNVLPSSDTFSRKINDLIFSGAQWKLQHHQAEEPLWRLINATLQLLIASSLLLCLIDSVYETFRLCLIFHE